MGDVASHLANRVQLTTDGYRLYLTAVDDAFAEDVDYAQLHAIYSFIRQRGWSNAPI
jgi:hypothetical protein